MFVFVASNFPPIYSTDFLSLPSFPPSATIHSMCAPYFPSLPSLPPTSLILFSLSLSLSLPFLSSLPLSSFLFPSLPHHPPHVVLSPSPMSPTYGGGSGGSDEAAHVRSILEGVCHTHDIGREAVGKLCSHVQADPQEQQVQSAHIIKCIFCRASFPGSPCHMHTNITEVATVLVKQTEAQSVTEQPSSATAKRTTKILSSNVCVPVTRRAWERGYICCVSHQLFCSTSVAYCIVFLVL